MILYSAPLSPFSAKVRMAAVLCDVALEKRAADTVQEPDELLAANPLGKIPALVLDDGSALYDSRVICDYLDRIGGNPIVPQTNAEWLRAKRLEATADGITDAGILIVYESRFRPADMLHQPWVDRQWRKMTRGLDMLEAELGDVPSQPTIGHLAVAAMAGWLDVRFRDRWDADRPKLRAWADGFRAAFPLLADVMPKA